MNPFTQGRDRPPAFIRPPQLYIDPRGGQPQDSARQSPDDLQTSAWGRTTGQLQLSAHSYSHSRSGSDPPMPYDPPESPHVVANTPWPEMPLVASPAHHPSHQPSRGGSSAVDEPDWQDTDLDKRRKGSGPASTSGASGASPWSDSAYHTPLPGKLHKQVDRQHSASSMTSYGQGSLPSYGPKKAVQRSYGSVSEAPSSTHAPDRLKTAGSTALNLPSNSSQAGAAHYTGSHSCLAIVVHYILLLFAEFPRKAHREWSGVVVRPLDSSGELGDMASMECGSIQRRLFLSRPKAAFVPLENLEQRYANNPKRRRLVYALRRKSTGSGYQGLWDHIRNELFIWGELAFDRCTPRKLRNHMPWFTAVFIMVNTITYAFMAGEYSSLRSLPVTGDDHCAPSSYTHGPAGLASWVVDWDDCHKFNDQYLILWGARYGPNLDRGQVYRWFSSLLIHDDLCHLVTTMALLGVLSLHVERRYGTSRTLLLAFLAACGGSLFSAAFENNCKVALGSSGAAFGLLGLFVADLTLNFDAVRFPVPRILLATAALVGYILANVLDGSPYRLASVGGLLCGLLPGALYLPHIKSEKYEWFIPFAALFITLGFLLALPLYVYLVRLHQLVCP